MGLFDEIKIPISYLKHDLDNEQIKVLKEADKKFFHAHTKDLDNSMSFYEIYRKKLHKLDSNKLSSINDPINFEPIAETIELSEYEQLDCTTDIKAYNTILDLENVAHKFVFNLHFKKGRLTSVELDSYDVQDEDEWEAFVSDQFHGLGETRTTKQKVCRKLADVCYKGYAFFTKKLFKS